MSACARPGCAGVIEDGFCSVCGMAPTDAAPAPTPPPVPGESTGTSRPSRRALLGAGLVEVPPTPRRDPARAVLADPEVPEHKRFCGHCDEPVSRRRNGRPSRPDGFCATCGTRYSFTPKLRAGDLVGGQYDVLGALAHGGLGWIYLARDRNVNDRWVVLKGLLDTGDAEAASAAIAERRFLAEVEHPNIVRIYNFVEHPDPLDGTMVGYLVMEYVGGDSLKQLRSRRDEAQHLVPLPVEQAIAYLLEVLPALGYLHDLGLLYCDFKPDNVIHSAEQLKLIDLGAVRRIDDQDGVLYKTDGYCAPELAQDGPSIGSDLYTVGRTLAVLIANFDYTGEFRAGLPIPSELPILVQHPSLHRFLQRATATDPSVRFESARIMADQLAGVLREILASQDGRSRPASSTMFGPERHPFATAGTAPRPQEVAAALPVPRVDETDAAAEFLASTAALSPGRRVDALSAAPQRTEQVRLALAHALIEAGRFGAAEGELDRLYSAIPHDWRLSWYRGLCALAEGRVTVAFQVFTAAYALVPGEPSVKLALGACHEIADRLPEAERLYQLVWRTDHAYTSAAFGLARMLTAARKRAEAIEVLEAVPSTSSYYVAARLAAIRVRLRNPRLPEISEQDLITAADQVSALDIEGERLIRISIEVLTTAHTWVRANGPLSAKLLDCQLTDHGLRGGLEHRYRSLARLTDNRAERVRFVEQANEIRPISWV